jgi:peptidoglycan/LPS O-acetylase OafA/YrhL
MESPPRTTPAAAPAHVEVLDGMRGLLTLLVLVHHVVSAFLYALPLDELSRHKPSLVFAEGSAVALPMYFVISGFVIFLPAARGNGKLGSLRWYVLRRVARIVPAYFLCLGIQLLVWPFLFSDVPSPMGSRRGVELVMGHLVFLQKLLFDERDIGFGLNGSVWTLTLEEFFYATIPIFSLWVFRFPRRMFAATLLVTLGWRLGSYYLPELAWAIHAPTPDYRLPSHLFHQFPGYAFQFVTGSLVALLYVRLWGKWTTPKWWTLSKLVHAFCLVSIALAMLRIGFLTKHREITRDVTYDMVPALLFAAMILVVALGPAGPKKLYTNPFCRFFGDISYGVYLWHMLLIQVVYRYGGTKVMAPEQAILTYLAWVVPGSLFLGWASFRFVERPLSLYVKKLYQEQQRSSVMSIPVEAAAIGPR